MRAQTLPASLLRHLKPADEIETIRDAADLIAQALEQIHGCPFKARIGSDCSFVFVTRVRDGGVQ